MITDIPAAETPEGNHNAATAGPGATAEAHLCIAGAMRAAKALPLHSGGAVAPLHPLDRASLPRYPGQPCSDWMRGNGLSRCIDSQAFAPDTTSRGVPPPCAPTTRAPVGYAVRGFRAPDTHEQGRIPCTSIIHEAG